MMSVSSIAGEPTCSIGEEMLFRGGMQPALGLTATSLLFGACHVPVHRALALWPLFAAAVGLLLGWTLERTGTLAAPVAGHFAINAVNLWRLARAAC